MGNEATIQDLERKLADWERKANAVIEVINDLRQEDGLPPRPPSGTGSSSFSGVRDQTPRSPKIKSDTFFGKKLQTAVREYLEIRFAAAGGTDPATPKEIFDGITQGGYKFEAKTNEVALVGLRALLRKRTAFFRRLPDGKYGLATWYPDARRPRQSPQGQDAETETAASKDGESDEAAVA